MKDVPIPEKAPNNPYGSAGRQGGYSTYFDQGPQYDPRVNGLDGEALDALLKGRMEEGLRMGRDDGQKLAAGRYEAIYDEGYRCAAGEFLEQGRALVLSALVPALQVAEAQLTILASKSRSKDTHERCDVALQAIRKGFGQL